MVTKPGEFDSLKNDLRSLDSKINLVVQRIQGVEKNQEILGRTTVALNDRLKKAETGGSPGAGRIDADQETAIAELKKQLEELTGQVRELKYVLDTINPLEYATLDQVKELIADKSGK